jgi:hypothetical protein
MKAQTLSILTLCATLMVARAQTTQTTAAAPAKTPQATTAAPAPPPQLSSMEQMLKDVKQPVSWLTWGADLRIRNEYFNDAQTLSSDPSVNRYARLHSQDYFRFRGRLWASITPVDDLSLNGRVAAEPREWMEPSTSANFRGPNPPGGTTPGRAGFEQRYGIVDNMNVQWKNVLGLPATLTVGRQDLFLGDGWLVADGTPLDVSWTFFLDSARLNYEIKDLHTTVDAIGIIQYARPDAWMPTIGPSSNAGDATAYALTDQNEKGAILWIANKSIPEFNVDGYFIYKHDTRINGNPSSAGTFGDDADIYTMGGRLSGLVKEHWKYSAEGAYQLGEKHDPFLQHSSGGVPASRVYHDIKAFGVNSKLTYLFKDHINNQAFVSFEFLSGDDPNTGDDEMFDVLCARWPRWSELYAPYSYIPETRTGQMANLYRFGPGWSCTPMKDLDFSLNYNLMYSDQDVPTRANAPTAFSNNDSFRGHYLQAILKYKFSKHMTGHLWSEFVFPGHFYTSSGEAMTFLRAEMMFTL